LIVAKKAKKKASTRGRRSVYEVEKVTMYRAVFRQGRSKVFFGLSENYDTVFNLTYRAAKREREERGLEQGDERVMFPSGIIRE